MSWFSSFDAGGALNKLSDISTTVSSKVKASVNELSTLVPEIPDNDQTKFLRNLSLNSPDMVAERSQLDLEERRKEIVREHLSELLPWETHNEELGIFVEDCREGILALSAERCTFLLPFAPPKDMHLFPIDDDDGNNESNDDEDKGEEVDEATTEEIMKKLTKLQPLPLLLEVFDIDAHVGLIERLLGEDTLLAKMHSSLTGAGEKERFFWQNYFFHCAYTRYEKGLTIEEIWDRKPAPLTTQQMAADAATNTKPSATYADSPTSGMDDSKSVELTFELDDESSHTTTGGDGSSLEAPSSPLAAGTASTTADGIAKSSASGLQNLAAVPATGGAAASASSSSYEIIDGSGNDDISAGSEDEDGELDDLEAEIARELEED